MKRLLLAGIIVFCCTSSLCQDKSESWIDNKVLSIPIEETTSTTSIAQFIRNNFNSDRERLRAIYTWVTYNIRYDKDSMNAINLSRDPQTKITAALRRRKGVCENYAAIFHDIAVKSGLTMYIVSGYTKQWGAIDRSGHSWCAVRLENEWLLCDPTWDEGRRTYNYYLVPPGQMIASHMPFDPIWQLLPYPVTHEDFKKGTGSSSTKNVGYNVADSMAVYQRMNELERLESCTRRMRQAGIFNELVRNRLAYTEMQVSIIYEDRDMKLYNASVSDLNKALASYNEFIQFKNNQFLPAKNDGEIRDMFLPIETKLTEANKKLDSLSTSLYNSQYDPSVLQNRIETLYNQVMEQKDFLKRYFASNLNERVKLFHK